MNLLFISYYFPPTKTIACVRNFNICSELLNHFKIFVFTTSNQRRFLKDQYPVLNIEKKSLLWTLDLRTIIPNQQVRAKAADKKSIHFFYRLLWCFPFNLILGIGGILYILHGFLKGLITIRKNNITHLYSSFFPFSDHFICYLLKIFFPKLIWTTDFRDLQYEPGSDVMIWPKFQKWCNKIILKKANVVTTVSEGLKKHLSPYHSNVLVIRNSIGALNREISEKNQYQPPEKFTINYTGNLIPGKRDPQLVFKAIKMMLDNGDLNEHSVNIRYAGNYANTWKEYIANNGLEKIAETHNLVSIEKSYEFQQSSHINLLLTSSSSEVQGILTGKFYEYLYAEKPILVIINGPKDHEFEKIIDELNAGKIVYQPDPNSEENISDFILPFYKEWVQNGKIEFSYTEAKTNYTMKRQINPLLEQIITDL